MRVRRRSMRRWWKRKGRRWRKKTRRGRYGGRRDDDIKFKLTEFPKYRTEPLMKRDGRGSEIEKERKKICDFVFL
jgi:hypothetical protein